MQLLRPPIVAWNQDEKVLNDCEFPRRLAVYGSTGSIGKSSLEIASQHRDKFHINALFCQQNIEQLVAQASKYQPETIGVSDVLKKDELIQSCHALSYQPKLLIGDQEIAEYARSDDYDIQIAAIAGFSGLRSVINGVTAGKIIALANKESLVAAGEIILREKERSGAVILPLDSEHVALFQALQGSQAEDVDKLMLTASGGPFLNHTPEQLQAVTKEQALKHPNWDMGPKVSIDSSTMMNKALEFIEAYWLFGCSEKDIEVIVHPQSIVHSQILFRDNAVLAQLSAPDMKTMIAYSLSYPMGRLDISTPTLDYGKQLTLEFFPLDTVKFRAVKIAKECLSLGGNACLLFTLANEVAVQRFVAGTLSYTEIIPYIEDTIQRYHNKQIHSLDDIIVAQEQILELLGAH